MYKSVRVFTFGLLVISLVILLPFGISMNVISNALALNMVPSMNNYEQDLLKKYEKFYKDDSFREAYYNYHRQHHQQQIENELSQSDDSKQQQQQKLMTDSLIQQFTTQQQNPLSISQEQMYQQQIVKLKQFLETVR
jgi:hypothetical protein